MLPTIVLLGYFAEVAEDLDASPKRDRHYPFEFDRLGKYLGRGVYPFLMQLLVGLAFMVVFIPVILLGIAVGAVAQAPAAGVAVGLVVGIPLAVVGFIALWGMSLHAELSRAFYFGEAAGFTYDLVRRVGWRAVEAAIAFTMLSLVVHVAGMLMCFIGVYPAQVVVLAMQQHLKIQLYHRYLDEGGEPIEVG